MPLTAVVNTFAGNPLDRASEMRGDPAWLAEQRAAAGVRVLALWNGQPLVREAPEGGVCAAVLPAPLARDVAPGEARWLFLGLDGETPVFAIDLETPADPAEGPLAGLGRFTALREAAPALPADEAAILATAKAVFEWRRRHGFCSSCGQPTTVVEGGWKRVCEACRTEHFPRTDPVVIMLPTFGDRCLLGRQARWAPGMFSALAGFVEPGETFEEACAREVKEEAGLTVTAIRYHSSQPWPYPSSLMIGLIAEVGDDDARPDLAELEAVRWFTRGETRALLNGEIDDAFAPQPLAIAHQLIRTWSEA